MALIEYGVTTCPLCGQVISAEEEVIATSHFIPDESDGLWRFSDAAMHRKCFLAWPRRGDFVAKFNREMAKRPRPDGSREQMKSDGTVVSVPA
jgi:hypothetical protein